METAVYTCINLLFLNENKCWHILTDEDKYFTCGYCPVYGNNIFNIEHSNAWENIRDCDISHYSQHSGKAIKGVFCFGYNIKCQDRPQTLYEVRIWSSWNAIIASMPAHLDNLLIGVTFRVLSLSSYVLSLTMLSLLETLLELLLWKSFQYHHHIFQMSSVSWNLRSFKAYFIFWNSQR